jgi:hypothetical protein
MPHDCRARQVVSDGCQILRLDACVPELSCVGRVERLPKGIPVLLREANPAREQPVPSLLLRQVFDLGIRDPERLELIPAERLGLGRGRGQARQRRILSLSRLAQPLTQEQLDRRDSSSDIRDRNLDSLPVAAIRALKLNPRRLRGRGRRIKQRSLNILHALRRSLGQVARAPNRLPGLSPSLRSQGLPDVHELECLHRLRKALESELGAGHRVNVVFDCRMCALT